MDNASASMSGKLSARPIRSGQPKAAYSVTIPKLGRILFTRDEGEAAILGREAFATNLTAHRFDGDGKHVHSYDLGSGLTTQALAIALSQQGVSAAGANTLGLLKYMASGTGVATANAYDYQLTTQAGPVSTAVTPTYGLSGNNATIAWTGTINYSSSLAITEWGLFAGTGTVGSQYSTAANAFTATTMTPTTSPTWTLNTWAGGYICQVASATPVIGLATSNTATALTVSAWATANATGGTGTTPATNTSATILPLIGDHKVFAAINVVSGDSIQYSYTLTCNAGG